MSVLTLSAETVFAPTTSGGAPRGAAMGEAYTWSTEVERLLLAAIGSGGALVFNTRAELYATLNYPQSTMAWVMADATAAYNGIYRKFGAANAGSWSRIGNLPYSVVPLTNGGTGTANDIVATSSLPINSTDGSLLITLPIVADNTTTSVNVIVNGETLAVKTASGNSPVVGGLKAGSIYATVRLGNTLRMLSDQASLAIQTAIEAIYADFQSTFLGLLPANPTTDANGNALRIGAWYFNTAVATQRWWDGSVWQTFPYATVADGAITLAKIQVDLIRTPCYADFELHCAAGGSNSNPGTSGSPLADANEIWRILRDRMDGRGKEARIKLIGLNNAPIDVFGGAHGFTQVYIEGYGVNLGVTTEWDDVSIATSGLQSVRLGFGSRAWCRGFKVGATGGHGLVAWWPGSLLEWSSMVFGACDAANGAQVWATQGGQGESYGSNIIVGGAGSHWQASHGGRLRNTTGVMYLGANVAFAIATAYALNGEIVLTGTPPVGGAFNPAGFTPTGKQFLIDGDPGQIQAYGIQLPIAGDFFGTLGGEVKAKSVYGPRILGSVISPPALAGVTHDWNPYITASGVAMKDVARVRMFSSLATDLTGLFSTGIRDGQLVMLTNVGSYAITLKHLNSGSISADQFAFPAGADMIVPPLGSITLYRDGTAGLWLLVSKGY